MHDPRVLLDPATEAVRTLSRRGFQLDLDQLDMLLNRRNTAIQQIDKVVHAGLAALDGDRYRVASPRLPRAVAELIRTGVPLAAVLEFSGQLLRSVDDMVHTLINVISEHVLQDRNDNWLLDGGEIPELTTLAEKIKPLGHTAISAGFNLSLERHVEDVLGEHIAPLMPALHQAARVSRDQR